jgi:hypothetical protein
MVRDVAESTHHRVERFVVFVGQLTNMHADPDIATTGYDLG